MAYTEKNGVFHREAPLTEGEWRDEIRERLDHLEKTLQRINNQLEALLVRSAVGSAFGTNYGVKP